MSQSHHSTDTQALLQSMLQRLKLQQGREGQAYLQTPANTASTLWQEGGNQSSNYQEVNNSSFNVFGANGVPSKEFRITTVDSNFVIRPNEEKPFSSELGRSPTSFPFQKVKIDGNREESGTCPNRVLGQLTQPGVIPAPTTQLFPAQSPKDADFPSDERTKGERVAFGSFAMKRHIPADTDIVSNVGTNQNHVQEFTPKVYTWSTKSIDADSAGQVNKMLNMGNGEAGGFGPTNDILRSQNPTISMRKQRSSENKTRRWTQRIKERWKDKHVTFAKKGKEEGGTVNPGTEKETQVLNPNQQLMTDNLMNTSNEDRERSSALLDSSGPGLMGHLQTKDNVDSSFRCTSDFDIGLGSFSLLDEIVRGQEWAKFINPNLSATPTKSKTSEDRLNQPDPKQFGSGSNQWSFRSTESSPAAAFSAPQPSPATFTYAGMGVSKEKPQWVNQNSDQSEPMEDGHNQSDMQFSERGLGLQPRPSFAQLADNLHNSPIKTSVQISRKRQHRSAVKLQIRDGQEADGGSTSSCHMMDESGQTLYAPTSYPTPLSNHFAPAPRGVLKHTMSQDSESSMETLSKRRRVEEKRRVHFSEEVVTILAPELDLITTDSEEESGTEEDSVLEQECEVEQTVTEEMAPARRLALPAWMLALKRKGTGRKH
ncbi:uncharacterized protein ACNS7B_012785 isoform 2-T2 [Menidia menidia]